MECTLRAVATLRGVVEQIRIEFGDDPYLRAFERGLGMAKKKKEFATKDAFASECAAEDRGLLDGAAGDGGALQEFARVRRGDTGESDDMQELAGLYCQRKMIRLT